MAGPATWHEEIATKYGASDEAPCADLTLLPRLRGTSEYAQIAGRVITLEPADAWQEDGLHFFVFRLSPNGSKSPEPPMAVFVMKGDPRELLSAVTVTPTEDGASAQIVDLRESGSGYVAPLAGERGT